MPQKRLNADLLTKMARKSGKPEQYLRERISRRASKQGISSAAAQLIWAKEFGIGIANALNKVAAEVRQEVRSLGPGPTAAIPRISNGKVSAPRKRKGERSRPPQSVLCRGMNSYARGVRTYSRRRSTSTG